jgi:hypothetical protein
LKKSYALRIYGPNPNEEVILRSKVPFGAIAKGDKVDLRAFRDHGFSMEPAYMGVVREVIHLLGDERHEVMLFLDAVREGMPNPWPH